MTHMLAFTGASIFTGQRIIRDGVLLINGDYCVGLVSMADLPVNCEIIRLDKGLIVPGFIDLQVNGGGGVLLNENPSLEGIETICHAHAQFGTTALLPTLITDTPDITKHALAAAAEAQSRNIPGFLGLHLEGPHLALAKKGAHSEKLIRIMTDKDVVELCNAKQNLDHLLLTIAPESVENDQITELVNAGIKVSLGHTAVNSIDAKKSFSAGASSVTHLYNAMTPLKHREPGLVGAALNSSKIYCGLIADGIHVKADAINIALRMKTGPGKICLVTDAMSTIGTDLDEIQLNGRTVLRKNGKLTLIDGTLAGTDLDMISAIRFMVSHTDCNREEAFKMASLYPATYLGIEKNYGLITAKSKADFVCLDEQLNVLSVWINGRKVLH